MYLALHFLDQWYFSRMALLKWLTRSANSGGNFRIRVISELTFWFIIDEGWIFLVAANGESALVQERQYYGLLQHYRYL